MMSRQKGSKQTTCGSQLDLFSRDPQPEMTASDVRSHQVSRLDLARASSALSPAVEQSASIEIRSDKATAGTSALRVIALEDFPQYSKLDHEMVDRSLEVLPADKVWFTYSAVQQSFGISRATIARRMKEGLIPGIRFLGSNVLEDGAVRRFNRLQLRWLLLATRYSRAEHLERSRRNFRPRAPVP